MNLFDSPAWRALAAHAEAIRPQHLRDIEELSYDEIAETLSISLEQVKINLHRARKTIRERMTEVRSER